MVRARRRRGLQPRFTIVDVDGRPLVRGQRHFRTDAGNGIAAEDDQNAFLNGLGNAVTQVRAEPEVDVLGALDLAGRSVQGNRPGTVVLVDSGLSTVAPLDFRQPGLLDAPVGETVEFLRANDALPGLQGVVRAQGLHRLVGRRVEEPALAEVERGDRRSPESTRTTVPGRCRRRSAPRGRGR